jgi:hypothetical protein
MKIKIGPYLNWWGPYQIFEKLAWLFGKERTRRWAMSSPEWFTNTCQWVYDKRKRKIKIKIDDYDIWSMDNTLALIILPMLKLLKKNKHGTPILDVMNQTSNSAQGSFDFYAEGDDSAFKAGEDQWEVIMDKMIWSFEQIIDDSWEQQYTKQSAVLDLTEYPEDEGKTVIPVRWKVEGEYDWEGMKKHKEKIQEGLELFGHYFQNFWD